MQLIDGQSGHVLLENVRMAKTFVQRFRGLMFERSPAEDFGLWIEPCGSIHTFWMFISIDVYFLDSQGTILEVRKKVPPWRIVIPKQKSHAVLEIPHGGATLKAGMQVELRTQRQR